MNNWQQELKSADISLAQLLEFVQLKVIDLPLEPLINPAFKLKACRSYLQKIKPGQPDDPLLLQILPDRRELAKTAGYNNDPVGDLEFCQSPGLIHKYQGRALLIIHSHCPLNCRFCFRRNFPYQDHVKHDQALAKLRFDNTISEVILSGGDPLSFSNKKLAKLINKLEEIPHIKTLRLHSRYPAALIGRMDDDLRQIFANCRCNIVLVCHFNHAQEIDDEVIKVMRNFRAVATLLNQSVLLKGINDSFNAQHDLAVKLISAGIVPYYLHMLDKAQGTAHFAVDKNQALLIKKQMKQALPGYLVPKLVVDRKGEGYKHEVDITLDLPNI